MNVNEQQYCMDIINAAHDREKERLTVIIAILIIALILSNGFWIHRNLNRENDTVRVESTNN